MPDSHETADVQTPQNAGRSGAGRARKPAQVRSKARVEKLLDATMELLATKGTHEIGLYDIAAAAGVPAGSVYHFFPSKESAFLAVAKRYEQLLLRHLDKNTDVISGGSWTELLLQRFASAAEFYNSNPAFAKLFLSGSMTAEVRGADIENVRTLSSTLYDWLDLYFKMPYLPDHEMKFTVLISLNDGIWMTSYAQHARITEGFAKEASTASLAYCRTFLPEVIEHRPPEAGQEGGRRRRSKYPLSSSSSGDPTGVGDGGSEVAA